MGSSIEGKKSITINNAFKKILYETDRKQNKMWVDCGSKFYNRSMQSWFGDNGIEMY